jgi:hypothetical protein
MFRTGFYSYDEKEFRDSLRNGQTNRQEESATALEAIHFFAECPASQFFYIYLPDWRPHEACQRIYKNDSLDEFDQRGGTGIFQAFGDMSRVFKLLPAFLLINCAFYYRLASKRVSTVGDEPNAICLTI